MNLLFVNNIPFNPIAGGIERVTDNLAKELKKRGHSIYYLFERLPNSKLYLLDYESPADWYQMPNYGMFDDEENISFYKQIQDRLRIDIVINQRGLDGWFNSMLQATDVKLISVLHATPNSTVSINLKYLEDHSAPPFVACKKIIKRMFPVFFKNYWRREFMKRLKQKYVDLAHYSDAIVTLSKSDGELMKQNINAEDWTKVTFIGNPNTFPATRRFHHEKKRNVILYVGRLCKEQKEPLRLLKIWKKLYQKYSEWHLKFVGDGEEMRIMKEFVKQQNLSNVSFEGQKANIVPYYEEASFVCLTSNFEGWGMVLTEGMQYGCIPVTFNNYGAASDIVDDSINGCLIPAFDLEQYAFRLSELMSNDDKRIEMSKAAIEKVKTFSVEGIVDKWEKLFQSL